MAADQRFELDLASALHRHLDAAHGPHGRWVDSPAAMIVAGTDRAIARRAGASRSALLLTAALAIALIAGALIFAVGSGRREAITPPPASPTVGPSPSAKTAKPSPTPQGSNPVAVVTAEPDPCTYFTTTDAQALWPGRKLQQVSCRWVGGAGGKSSIITLGVDVLSSSDQPGGGSDLSYEDAWSRVSPDSVRLVRGLGDKAFIARGFEGKSEGSIHRCCNNAGNDWAQAALIVVRSGTTVIEIRAWAWGSGMATSDPWSARTAAAKIFPSDAALIRAARLELDRLS